MMLVFASLALLLAALTLVGIAIGGAAALATGQLIASLFFACAPPIR